MCVASCGSGWAVNSSRSWDLISGCLFVGTRAVGGSGAVVDRRSVFGRRGNVKMLFHPLLCRNFVYPSLPPLRLLRESIGMPPLPTTW